MDKHLHRGPSFLEIEQEKQNDIHNQNAGKNEYDKKVTTEKIWAPGQYSPKHKKARYLKLATEGIVECVPWCVSKMVTQK